ncbi:MAG: tRNA (adenosine(37)-N6)-threonylcarbamoyltransferase complex ATPase subunit type 1 TsaE [Peptococcaceae bacterium]|jgi:tRNA threonylcarbamoyladenosine biosynthesis protein TsaE|nr:tRNA (adenosine(37)-N6)-threonylcarbamoyltransferase complex ATPase subunit type 1 TsaE [Peptococcaceae bacterium]
MSEIAAVFYTDGPAETRAWGAALARLLPPGAFVALRGDLGAGKTCLAQGMAQGLGYPGAAASPTFGLIHEYLGGRLPFYHFDVYRLKDPSELEELGYEDYFYGDGVCGVEWSERVPAYLPADRLEVAIERRRAKPAAANEVAVNEAAANEAVANEAAAVAAADVDGDTGRQITVTAWGEAKGWAVSAWCKEMSGYC